VQARHDEQSKTVRTYLIAAAYTHFTGGVVLHSAVSCYAPL